MFDSPAPGTVSRVAPAKINLALHVTGRRDDGYHLLDSLVVFAGHGDRISVKSTAADSFAISGPFAAGLPADDGNLVIRARDALRSLFPGHSGAVAIHLEKNLPIASGIGGGSSDAAAVLLALARLWRLQIEPGALLPVALKLGADLPMCLHGRPLMARGIGEAIEPVAQFPHLPLVLANCGLAVSTPQAFAALDRRDNPGLPPLPGLASAAALCDYLAATQNHLYLAARKLSARIDDTLHALENTGPLLARMSGSGATCFAIYDSDAAAALAAQRLQQQHPDWFVMATHSPAEG
ncbi:4-(cytidine 5'-diphospho)-2-C-methyl-D-erythritol kinase [Phyllobacterium sp. 21LDTY02-6]|uniref:4-(cytidine 5'-diphospho)-2-C-methyl-D-erythritol kinase n=1 Tax=Phyllobacterium sp. 21LDTY02-6 TaxID=2944903 RepID=UPI002020F6F5|nr:4-(cytidine 5'-diphospho)-2-C-methyl-D-erythritol kinase [Phyllobacterium sp. 21LDTY02-6]MCO4318519.1 4-(cytidine 5'-diphospho)-2-C-methyl-D-erythritol kinase [Phyllobacterium sp. 21LDTY02-6]